MQKQKIRGMVLAAVVCCVSLSGCGAAGKKRHSRQICRILSSAVIIIRPIIMRMWTANQRG